MITLRPFMNSDRISISRTTALLALLAAIAAPIAAGAVLNYRVETHERRIEIMERKLESQSDVLARIDENVKILMRER